MVPTFERAMLDIYRREKLSFLQYVGQATAYASHADEPLRLRIQAMADSERVAVEKWATLLERFRIPMPHVGAFPTSFTNYNFVDLRKLLPLLIDGHGRDIAAMVAGLNDVIDSRELLPEWLAMKRAHLEEMGKLL